MAISRLFSPSAAAKPVSFAFIRDMWVRPVPPVKFLVAWAVFGVLLLALAGGFGFAPQGALALADGILAVLGFGSAHDVSSGAGADGALAAAIATAVPAGIIAPAAGISAPIVFPEETGLAVLNDALMRGVVHYPGSAMPGEKGTVFLFGHSTGLAAVRNRNFEAFNRLPELAAGDVIRLAYAGREHWYRVRSVELKLTDAAAVDLAPASERLLVLTTCNVFGGKDDRFIVTAEFVGSYPLERV